jgi:ferric-dicitrate binding protein FerR (iron transport regulator)
METTQRDNREKLTAEPADAARLAIAEATEVIGSTRASSPEHAAAYRRRARAWRQLAQSLPYHPQVTPTMLHAATDDLSRARLLSNRGLGGEVPPPR